MCIIPVSSWDTRKWRCIKSVKLAWVDLVPVWTEINSWITSVYMEVYFSEWRYVLLSLEGRIQPRVPFWISPGRCWPGRRYRFLSLWAHAVQWSCWWRNTTFLRDALPFCWVHQCHRCLDCSSTSSHDGDRLRTSGRCTTNQEIS